MEFCLKAVSPVDGQPALQCTGALHPSLYYRENNRVLTDIAAAPNSISLLVDTNFGNREVRAMARPVSANYFDVMRIRPYRWGMASPP
jgi:hypothetical protein